MPLTVKLDRLMYKLKEIDDERSLQEFFSTDYLGTKSTREESRQKAIELEIEMRKMILYFMKGENQNGSSL